MLKHLRPRAPRADAVAVRAGWTEQAMSQRTLYRLLAAVGGGAVGFAYYYFVGCRTGACPISGNPWIATAYGAVVGVLLVPADRPAVTRGSTDETVGPSGSDARPAAGGKEV